MENSAITYVMVVFGTKNFRIDNIVHFPKIALFSQILALFLVNLFIP